MDDMPKGNILARMTVTEDEMWKIPAVLDDSSKRKWAEVSVKLGDIQNIIDDTIDPLPSPEDLQLQKAEQRFQIQYDDAGKIALMIGNRAERLAALLYNRAPAIIVSNELELIEGAYSALIQMARRQISRVGDGEVGR